VAPRIREAAPLTNFHTSAASAAESSFEEVHHADCAASNLEAELTGAPGAPNGTIVGTMARRRSAGIKASTRRGRSVAHLAPYRLESTKSCLTRAREYHMGKSLAPHAVSLEAQRIDDPLAEAFGATATISNRTVRVPPA
jgi:hypothetical protein